MTVLKMIDGKTTQYTYDKANQLVSSTCGEKTKYFAYDAAGRLVKEGTKSYNYCYMDKVRSVSENGAVTGYFLEVLMDICIKFGNRVRKLRIAQGLSQETLAQKAGLHRTYIGGIERGERNISLINIQKISIALHVTIEDIMKGF